MLADYLLRITPPEDWRGARILELGCGVGQLGIPLAMSGAAVTMTDLEHIVPLTQQNVDANAHGMAVKPRVMPFMWGTDSQVSCRVAGHGWLGRNVLSNLYVGLPAHPAGWKYASCSPLEMSFLSVCLQDTARHRKSLALGF